MIKHSLKIATLLSCLGLGQIFGEISKGKFGMEFGFSNQVGQSFYAPTIGVRWHVSDQIALRPSIGWMSNSLNIGGSPYTTNTFAFGLGMPIYLLKFTSVHFYVAPSVAYHYTVASYSGLDLSSNSNGYIIALGASAGFQVPVSEQLQVFGEVGFGYTRSDFTKMGYATAYTNAGLTITSLGVLIYLN